MTQIKLSLFTEIISKFIHFRFGFELRDLQSNTKVSAISKLSVDLNSLWEPQMNEYIDK